MGGTLGQAASGITKEVDQTADRGVVREIKVRLPSTQNSKFWGDVPPCFGTRLNCQSLKGKRKPVLKK